jgi:ABC-type bacteriocin/lantibiotic exporter with double-glycine peptidase domain
VIAGLALAAALAAAAPDSILRLPVPLVRQASERCGPAALVMVLRFFGAGPGAVAEAERAYDPVLRGALITELAAAARRAGADAAIETPGADSLVALLRAGIPPILLYETGTAPVARAHYGVVVGWEPRRDRFVLHDGGDRPRVLSRAELVRHWRGGDGLALVVRRRP